jgi:DHA1 family multidrug resistance protein-like MFS transporter
MTPLQQFLLLCGVGVFCFLSYNLVRMPVLALFAQSLGAGPEMIGLIVSLSTLTGVLLKLPSGALSDIYGRQRVMQIGVLAFGLPPFAYPFITDLEWLAALRFVHGLATAVFAPTALAAVAEMYQYRGERGLGRGAALGWYTASTQSGALLGPVIGGWLAYTAGFPVTFLTGGLFGCIGIVLLYLLRLPPPPLRVDASVLQAVRDMRRTLSLVGRNIGVIVTSATDAAKMIANGALMAFLPIYAVSVGLNAGEVGLLFGVQGITSFFSKPIMGRVSDQVGRRPLIFLGLIICATTFTLIPRFDTLAPLLIIAAGFGFGEAVVSSSSAALVADLSGPQALGAGMGMQGMVMDIGHATGPILAGVLIAQMSYQLAFAIIAGLQLLAAAIFWRVVRSERHASPSHAA